MQPIIRFRLVPAVFFSISTNTELMCSESEPIFKSFLSLYGRLLCTYRLTPPPRLLTLISFQYNSLE